MKRVLLVAATTGYQVREFAEAARALDVELVLATDRCHILENPWGDDAAPVRFEDPEPGIEALAARGPFDGILAVGDRPACVAAQAAEQLGLRFHPAEAARAASNKLLTREHFRAAGMPVPKFRRMPIVDAAGADVQFPCVLKPLDSSASRGVIRANNREEFWAAADRIARIQDGDLIVEDYIPGREFALEGVVTAGKLQTLALFDKPDPLEGPYFEETIYVTPSREPEDIQRQHPRDRPGRGDGAGPDRRSGARRNARERPAAYGCWRRRPGRSADCARVSCGSLRLIVRSSSSCCATPWAKMFPAPRSRPAPTES